MKATAPTRIVFLVGTLNLGGIERQVTDLATSLVATGEWEPVVLCLIARTGPFVQELEKNGVAVYECPLSQSNLYSVPYRLSRQLKEISPALVHSHVAYSIPWQVLGIRLAGIHKIVFTQQNEYQYWKSNRLARLRLMAYFRVCWPFISAYTTVSQGVQKSLSQLVRLPADRFQVIYNSVNTSIFRPNPELRESARKRLGFGDDQFVVGNVGRLTEQKGQTYLLKAARQVIDVAPEVRFAIVGSGPLAGTLAEEARALGIEEYVSFLGPHHDVQDIYPAFDCFCSASLWEGCSLVLCEAMAASLPIVATRVGATELLDEESSWLAEPGDASALTRAIIEALSYPELAKRKGKNARQIAEQVLSLEAIMRQYEALYRELLQ